jgi:hypothetical protein
MRASFLARLFATFISLSAAAVLTLACRGGGEDGETLTLPAYFAAVQEADDTASARFQQIRGQLGEGQSEGEELEALKQVYPQQVATLRDLVEQLEALRPPDEVEEEHEAAVEALKRSIEVTEKGLDEVRRATELAAVSSFLQRQEVLDADQRTSETCATLELAGTQLGINVDLDC